MLRRQHLVPQIAPLIARRLAAAAAAMSVVAVVSIWSAAPAAACSCVGFDDAQAFENAAVVFRGELVEVQTSSTGEVYSSMDPERFIFDVERVYKGEARDHQTVVTARGGESCGLEISGRGPFLVFAHTRSDGVTSGAREGELYANLCGGTREAASTDDELFGPADEPITPLAAAAPVPTDSDDGFPVARAVSVASAAVAIAIALWLAASARRPAPSS